MQAAQLEVAGGQLTDQRHLQRGQVGTGGAQLGPLRFAGAAQAAEQIQLPTETGGRLIQLDAVVTGARRRAFHIRQVLLGGGRGNAHVGQLLGTAAAQQRFGALVAGQRRAQVAVGVQGLADQPRQHRVVEAGPEALLVGAAGRRLRRLQEALRRVRLHRLIVRPHGAAGKPRQGRQQDNGFMHDCLQKSGRALRRPWLNRDG